MGVPRNLQVIAGFGCGVCTARLVGEQDALRQSRAAAQAGLNDQIEEQIAQLGEQITGLEAQQASVREQSEIVAAELADAETLFADGLVLEAKVTTARRELARLDGEAGNLAAEVAAARTAIAASRAKMTETAATFRSGVLEELRDAGQQIAELMQQKIAAEDRLRYDEPPGWILPVRHALGANLMAHGRYREAEAVYREDLKRLPNNGWSLLGLSEALAKQENEREAGSVLARFATVWRDADVRITSSCFCQPGAE